MGSATTLSRALLALGVTLAAGCAIFGPSERELERTALAQNLGQDPAELLAAIARAPAEERRLRVLDIQADMPADDRLRLLRFGLGHDREMVVFGAVLLMPIRLAVPELANAAGIVLPRIGQADCPVSAEQARPLIGSADFDALAKVLPRLDPDIATRFVHNLHRMARPDAVPTMCRLAQQSDGALRDAWLSNLRLVTNYDGRHDERVFRTWLAGLGLEPDPNASGRLPGVLRAMLRAAPDHGFPGARWLYRTTPDAADLPLIQGLLAVDSWATRCSAAWALGAMSDPESLAILQRDPPANVHSLVWIAARARRGDAAALDALFAGDTAHLMFALSIAEPERRQRYFAELLSRPATEAAKTAYHLGWWPRASVAETPVDPPYDDLWFDGLEPLLASRDDLDPVVLRAFVDALPCCETIRLADLLLAAPVNELFGELDDEDWLNHRWVGHGGVWAFLEVTRPERFRRLLRAGVTSDDEAIRTRCAGLLARLGGHTEAESLAAIIDWLVAEGDDIDWQLFARGGDRAVVQVLEKKLGTVPAVLRGTVLAAIAVAHGMPVGVGWDPEHAAGDPAGVRQAVLAGDPAQAYVFSKPELPTVLALPVVQWRQPSVTKYLAERRANPDVSHDPQSLYGFDLAWDLVHGTAADRERLMQPIVDGRYATHDTFPADVAAASWSLDGLPFWIDELGTNCCKVVLIEEVLEQLFGCDSEAFDRSEYLEPAAAFLRRTLLPVRDRLRWSRIANGYVVAGR